jgi:hypothetical protein
MLHQERRQRRNPEPPADVGEGHGHEGNPMNASQRRRLLLAAALAAYLLALWVLWPSPVVYPLKIFVVFLHELSHALAAVATGGEVASISLDAREGGATWVRGGSRFITLSAGYLGSLLWGLALLAVARFRPRLARAAVQALGMLTLLATLVYVRGFFGLAFGLLFGFALFAAGRRLQPDSAALLLGILGLTSAVYALLDIRSDILLRPGALSDAALLAQLTGIPAILWGLLWGVVAIAATALMFHRLWRAR